MITKFIIQLLIFLSNTDATNKQQFCIFYRKILIIAIIIVPIIIIPFMMSMMFILLMLFIMVMMMSVVIIIIWTIMLMPTITMIINSIIKRTVIYWSWSYSNLYQNTIPPMFPITFIIIAYITHMLTGCSGYSKS